MTTRKNWAPGDLQAEFAVLRAREPRIRPYDAARTLQTSEAELVASGCGSSATRLRPEWTTLLPEMESLGEVMGLTRNEWAVIEKHGRYRNVELGAHAGTVLDEGLDLRVFPSQWTFAYAVQDGARRSIQVFDRHGVAVHKTFLLENSGAEAYGRLVAKYAAVDRSMQPEVVPLPAPQPGKSDSEVNVVELRHRWSQLRDTHEFFRLLRELQVERIRALRLVGADWARPVQRLTLREVLEWAVSTRFPVMVFVANPGNIQIHTGPVENLKQAGEWFNVLDRGFNLHIHEVGIDSAWVVRKPTSDGVVTSLELYAADGTGIVSLFSKRKPGQVESTEWRTALAAQSLDVGARDRRRAAPESED